MNTGKEREENLAQLKAFLQLKPLKLTVPVIVVVNEAFLRANTGAELSIVLSHISQDNDVCFIVKESNAMAATEDMKHNGYVLVDNQKYPSEKYELRKLNFKKK